ncbi:chymotrypsin inhibitor-like [Spea bombifrons]|uniref:chymotrypsin inhibitor-like n=1 Tax=Spea bombifrons TaxID=233779 RepID=UPI00234B73D2|nr:chymotrypsin inhibitor-like [Spea bombifrons]
MSKPTKRVALALVCCLLLLNQFDFSFGETCGNGTFSDCASACPGGCSSQLRRTTGKFRVKPEVLCMDVCRVGCVCSSGYVLKDPSRCVLPQDC